MLHLRLLVPAELSSAVLELLAGYPGVTHLTVVPGAGRRPAGDLVEADVAREAADELITALVRRGLDRAGAITAQDVTLAVSDSAHTAQRQAPGNSRDSVVWRQVEESTAGEAALSGTYLAFLTIATMLAAIGIVLNSQITIVGAMVVGPEFGPLAAIAVGLVRRRGDLAGRGAVAIFAGFPIAMAITAAAAWVATQSGLFSGRDLDLSQQTEFIYQVGPFSFIVALLAGAAGMLSMTSGKSAALVGVFISVTTVPAAGYVAVAGVLGHWAPVGGAALQLLINLCGIVVAAVVTLLVVRRVDAHRATARTVRA